MNKAIPALTALLIVQVALAFGIKYAEGMSSSASSEKVIKTNIVAVDQIVIEENSQGKTGKLVLKKTGESWTLPDKGDFPASAKSVNKLLDKLKGLLRGWPVATSEDAAPRFKVGANNWSERIVLSCGGKDLVTAFIGTPAGHNKVHLRLDAENEINAVELEERDIRTDADSWIDREIVAQDAEKVNSVVLPKLSLSRKGKEFELSFDGKLAPIDATTGGEVFDNACGVNISDVLGKDEKPEYGLAAPAFSYELALKDGRKLRFSFGKLQGSNFYVLRQPQGPFFLKVDSWFVDRLQEINPAALAKRAEQLRKLREQADKVLLKKVAGDKEKPPAPRP